MNKTFFLEAELKRLESQLASLRGRASAQELLRTSLEAHEPEKTDDNLDLVLNYHTARRDSLQREVELMRQVNAKQDEIIALCEQIIAMRTNQ